MMKKVLMLNGSPHENGCTYTALCELERTLQKHGIGTEIHWLGKAPVAGCIACGRCGETGRCVFEDGVNALLPRLDEFGALVAASPVYYAGASGQLTAFLDRLFYAGGARMAGKIASAVVSCRRGGASAAFEQINKYFGMSNMVIAASQYWNQVHGSSPEDVLRDEEGLQTMRTLGENIAWLLRLMDAGEKAGVCPPVYEKKVRTNFIR